MLRLCDVLIKIFFYSVADRMCRSGAVDLICIDSVSALTPRAEIEVSYMDLKGGCVTGQIEFAFGFIIYLFLC